MKSFFFALFSLPLFAFAFPGHHARQLSASPVPAVNATTLRTTEEAIPIATICPPGSPTTDGSFNSYLPMINVTSSSTANTTIQTISATSTVETLTETGVDGCSTLYTPVTTPICHTTLSGMGQIPITVTDCMQLVTFSTSSDCAAATASGIVMGDKRTFFLAPWRVIASGVVPSNVTVEDCLFGQGGEDCSTSTESWTLTTETLDVPVTRSIEFQGSIVGPAVLTLGGGIFTTAIPASTTEDVSINTLITTSSLSPYVSIERLTATVEELTSTITQVETITQTFYVNAVSQTTVTSIQTTSHIVTTSVARR